MDPAHTCLITCDQDDKEQTQWQKKVARLHGAHVEFKDKVTQDIMMLIIETAVECLP